MRGDLSPVLTVSGVTNVTGTIQEADLAEDLVVDGEIYVFVELLLSGRHS